MCLSFFLNMETDVSRIQCCNPLKKANHFVRDRKKLRSVTAWMPELYPQIISGSKICDKCRKEISEIKNAQSLSDKNSEDEQSQAETFLHSDSEFTTNSEVVQSLNISLEQLGESPIAKRKMKCKKYGTAKVHKISSTIKQKLFSTAAESSSSDDNHTEKLEVIENLKIKFSSCTSRTKKLMLLTCLPENWSIRKIMREFDAPNYMVRQSKRILKEKGFLESPNLKPGKSLAIETVQTVRSFYEHDEVSRAMPGIKDCVTVTEADGRFQKDSYCVTLKKHTAILRTSFPASKLDFLNLLN